MGLMDGEKVYMPLLYFMNIMLNDCGQAWKEPKAIYPFFNIEDDFSWARVKFAKPSQLRYDRQITKFNIHSSSMSYANVDKWFSMWSSPCIVNDKQVSGVLLDDALLQVPLDTSNGKRKE